MSYTDDAVKAMVLKLAAQYDTIKELTRENLSLKLEVQELKDTIILERTVKPLVPPNWVDIKPLPQTKEKENPNDKA